MMPDMTVPHMVFQTPSAAWKYAMNVINTYGYRVVTEDGKSCREVRNLVLTVDGHSDPTNWPILGSGWQMPALREYANQLLSPDRGEFAYTYGNRLRAHIAFDGESRARAYDQLEMVVAKLKSAPSTRRAVMTTWYPQDIVSHHVPCMIMDDFLIREGTLYLTSVFRSHDIERAWPANVYGLSCLMQRVAGECGVKCGPITTVSVSAHIYEK